MSDHSPPPSGTHQVRMEFAYDGGGTGKIKWVPIDIDAAVKMPTT